MLIDSLNIPEYYDVKQVTFEDESSHKFKQSNKYKKINY